LLNKKPHWDLPAGFEFLGFPLIQLRWIIPPTPPPIAISPRPAVVAAISAVRTVVLMVVVVVFIEVFILR
jgi:hypothetical protein